MTKRRQAPRGRKVTTRKVVGCAIVVTGASKASIRAGTRFNSVTFKTALAVSAPEGGYVAGTDYAVHIIKGKAVAKPFDGKLTSRIFGGFHFAPGGNASAISGGDAVQSINPLSAWDRKFRPKCKDPRGMTFVSQGKFWCDIYLTGKNHLNDGTSRFGVTIADGNSQPQNPAGGIFTCFDFAAAASVMKHHGKQLMTAEEFFMAAYGVTERSSHSGNPDITKLDQARTSQCGLIQATGNLWVWGTDGHPDTPRPSVFGGSWFNGSLAGSRYAALDSWPENSSGHVGARGRSDHLTLE